MFGWLSLGFTTPAVLLALTALPALWLLLRVTPPQPRRIDFPPLRLILDLIPQQESPARTPWWLLALRLLVAGLVDCEHWDLFTLLRGKPLMKDAASATGPNVELRNAPFKSARRHPAPLPRRAAVTCWNCKAS